jgi:hypothetical protein
VQLVNVSLGPRDGIFLYDGAVLLTGWAAALLKAATEAWFLALAPLPYAALGALPRLRRAGGGAGAGGQAPGSSGVSRRVAEQQYDECYHLSAMLD